MALLSLFTKFGLCNYFFMKFWEIDIFSSSKEKTAQLTDVAFNLIEILVYAVAFIFYTKIYNINQIFVQ